MTRSESRALQITRNLPPLVGGMERLNQRMASLLSHRFELSVVGPSGCRDFLPGDARVREVAVSPLSVFLVRAALAGCMEALTRRPKWVIAGSGLTAPVAWFAARLVGARCAVYVHGLDLIVAQPLYQVCWLPFIRRANCVVVNSANTARLASEKGVPIDRIRVVNPGTDLPSASLLDARPFREAHGLGNRPLLLSVGRLTQRKGLRKFVELCLPALLQRFPELLLLIVGGDPKDALSTAGGSERQRIEEGADLAGVSGALRFLPPCSDAELSMAYVGCDVHVFPLVEMRGDVEGFGMVAVEAAAHGLPSVAYEVGGVADAVIVGVTGELVGAGDTQAMIEAVARWLERSKMPLVRENCRDAAQRWAWSEFEAGMMAILREFEVASR